MTRLAIIDLVRVIATWLVVFFHLEVSGFEYGYLGVELFLVLSGFLMLYIKKDGVQSFILARLKRIFPTLVVFSIGLGFLSFFLLVPEYYEVSFSYLIFAAFGLNYIWSNSFGYFGDIASLVPTLHLWTIPIEMTAYYWVAIGLSDKKIAKYIEYVFPLLIFGIDLWLVGDPYYNSTSRLLFFVLGAYAYKKMFGGEARQEIVKMILLFALTLFFYLLKGDTSYLLPQIALFVLILLSLANSSSPAILTAIGSSKPIRWLASISFETYLVHWGVISLWITLTLNTNLNLQEKTLLLPLIIIGAVALRELTKIILYTDYIGLISLCLVGAISVAGYASSGFAARLNSDVSAFSNQALMKLSKSELEELTSTNREIAIKFIGDSHARHFAAAAYNSGLEVGLKMFSIDDLVEITEEIDGALSAGSDVFIAFRWSTKDLEGVRALISKINEREVVVIRDIPSFPNNPVPCLISDAAPILLTGLFSTCDVFKKDESGNIFISRKDVSNSDDENWKLITDQLPAKSRLDSHDFLCAQQKCTLSAGNTLFYRDSNHLNEKLGYKMLGFSISPSESNE